MRTKTIKEKFWLFFGDYHLDKAMTMVRMAALEKSRHGTSTAISRKKRRRSGRGRGCGSVISDGN
jgi:hypothetical protein